MAAKHMSSSNGIKAVLQFLEHSDKSCRAHAFQLLSLLSEKLEQVLLEELQTSGKLPFLKQKLLDSGCPLGEKTDVACILSNLPVSDIEVSNVLGPDLLRWAVGEVRALRSGSLGKKHSKEDRNMVYGLLGLLLHYSRNRDPEIVSLIQENHLMDIFREQLGNHYNHRAKRLGSLGLKYLSESTTLSTPSRDLEPQPPTGCCAPFTMFYGKANEIPSQCPFHDISCADNSSFCLFKANAIKPLVDLLDDDNVEVQLSAVEALLTLVSDAISRKAVEKLSEVGLLKAAVLLFKGIGAGELQERVVLMVDRFLKNKSIAEQYSTDPDLVKALVEALKHGNSNTRVYAQDALQNLNQISGIGGRNSR